MIRALDGGGRGVVRSRTHDGAEEDGAGDLARDMVGDGEYEKLWRCTGADTEVNRDNWKHNAHDVKSWHSTCCRVHPIATTFDYTSTRSRLRQALDSTHRNTQSGIVSCFLL